MHKSEKDTDKNKEEEKARNKARHQKEHINRRDGQCASRTATLGVVTAREPPRASRTITASFASTTALPIGIVFADNCFQ